MIRPSSLKVDPLLHALPTDTIHHVLTFLDDTDLAESVHIGHGLYPQIRTYLRTSGRNPFHTACHSCYHPPPHCRCETKSRRVGFLYFFIVMGIILFCFLYPILKASKSA